MAEKSIKRLCWVMSDEDLNESSMLENGIIWRSDLLKSKPRTVRVSAGLS